MLPIVLAVGVIGASSAAARVRLRQYKRNKLNEAWAQAADELGVVLSPAGSLTPVPTLRGEVDGLRVAVSAGTTWSSERRRFRVWFPRVGPRGRVSRRYTVGGSAHLNVGDVAFDSRVDVESDEHNAWKAYLTPERRRAILSIFDGWDDVQIENGKVTASDMQRSTSTKDVAPRVRFLVEQAHVLGGRLTVTAVEPAPTPRDDVDVASSDQIDNAGWSLDEVVGWEAVRSSVGEAVPGPAPLPESVSAVDAVQHLFGVGVVDADERFDSYWSGRRVSWSGKVVSAMPFLDGELPKATIVVTIGHIDGMQLISNQVDAVVDVSGHPGVRSGQRFAFTGTLSGIDHPTRKLYVSDAQAN